MKKFGPIPEDMTELCAACGNKMLAGQYIALIPLGPGTNTEAQEHCRKGEAYNAIAVPAHYSCATGEQPK